MVEIRSAGIQATASILGTRSYSSVSLRGGCRLKFRRESLATTDCYDHCPTKLLRLTFKPDFPSVPVTQVGYVEINGLHDAGDTKVREISALDFAPVWHDRGSTVSHWSAL